MIRRTITVFAVALLFSCSERQESRNDGEKIPKSRPSILLVTLDTTRADAMGPHTPAFNALASRGRRYLQAYTTVPETLPAHTSMMTGVYPAGHGIHENARYISDQHELLAERLGDRGYETAAFVSAYPLARQFGLARGFQTYDDEFEVERSAKETTDRAIAYLSRSATAPRFTWVHYFDPHSTYAPPEPFKSQFRNDPYRGEVAAMDRELGRLLSSFTGNVIVVGDHGEALGDHGESEHGDLVYQPTMLVPMVIAGDGVQPGVTQTPVSTRRVFHTILDWAGVGTGSSLLTETSEVVLGEAMKPYLNYGWQPQIMAISGRRKVIHAGAIEVYDVVADPAEQRDLGPAAEIPREVRQALREYPIPSPRSSASSAPLNAEDQRRLASLGYVASDVLPVVRKDAPRARDMIHVLETLNTASALFAQQKYARAIPLFEQSLTRDPSNLSAALRLAVSFSSLGRNDRALAAFKRAEEIAPRSNDVRHFLALHYERAGEIARAEKLLETVLAEQPDRLPAIEALARIRERQERYSEAVDLWQRIVSIRRPSPAELIHLGQMAMNVGETAVALQSFEAARNRQGDDFTHHLELGVLLVAANRPAEAREMLDRVKPSDPGYAMALFKRAQVSVLLNESDAANRIDAARRHADATTRELIARERLFR